MSSASNVDPVEISEKTIEQLIAKHTAWYSSNDEENWQGGPYDSREEAETEARSNEHRLIVLASKANIRVSNLFDVETFLENAEESISDLSNEDCEPILDFTQNDCEDLQARVRAAIDDWQVARQLAPAPWCFISCGEPEIAAWAKDENKESQ